jgi:3-hydroxybutyryl-CoA dehydrogenase
MMNYIAVIGTGIMAAGIAAGFIAQSIPVVILGRTKEKADACLDKAIALACKIGLVGENAQKEITTPSSLNSPSAYWKNGLTGISAFGSSRLWQKI